MKRITICYLSLFVIVFTLLLTSSCENDYPNLAPGNIILISPFYSAIDISLDVSLSWQAASDPNGNVVTYDVYFGTETTPVTVVSSSQTGTTYSPTLAANTTYYWKVVAKDGKGGTSESAVWSFTTEIIVWSDATHGIFTDPRDNNKYDVIKIGEQIWFAENLSYEIAGKEITDYTQWRTNSAYDGWCYYNNDKVTNGSTYGILYQWEAAKVVCPVGWHLPVDSEWTILTDYLGGESEAGGKLKESGTIHWNAPNTGATNSSGFSALPGGYRFNLLGSFDNLGYFGFWWSATEHDETTVWSRHLDYDNAETNRYFENKMTGCSIRCIRD